MWWHVLVGIVAGLVLLYLVLVGSLLLASRRRPSNVGLVEALRLLPDVLRLVHRLAADQSLPPGLRIRLGLLLAYLASPIDLIPDFIPVLGYADDAIVVAVVLRSVARVAGPEHLARHWPGTPEGLRLVMRLAGLPERDATG